MIMRKRAVFGMAIGLTLAGVSLQADTLIIGTPANTANCDPFGCPAFFGLGTYQQVYSNAAFPGAMTIDDLILYESQVLHNGGKPSNGTYTLSFSYTTAAPGNLDLQDGPAANIAAGTEEQFFTGTLPALTPFATENLLNFSGTPFAYNPADGNLLLTVTVTGATDSKPYLYLDKSGSTSVTSDAYFGTVNGGNNPGLVTGLQYTVSTSPAPEPASLLLVLGGIGLIGYQRRRRHNN
jgi:hypothetical protein